MTTEIAQAENYCETNRGYKDYSNCIWLMDTCELFVWKQIVFDENWRNPKCFLKLIGSKSKVTRQVHGLITGCWSNPVSRLCERFKGFKVPALIFKNHSGTFASYLVRGKVKRIQLVLVLQEILEISRIGKSIGFGNDKLLELRSQKQHF